MPSKPFAQIEPYFSAFLVLAAGWLWGLAYLEGRSLFLDEANLALNIAERSWGAFFQQLDHEQYAPPLFLVLTKLATELLGYHVWGLRLVPLLAGVATLYFCWRLPARLGATGYRPLLLGLVVANEFTLRYFTECKQYGWDLAITLGLVYLALTRSSRPRRADTIWLAVAGALAVWASMPSVFVLAGIGGRGLWIAWRQGDRPAMLRWFGLAVLWLGNFGLYYGLILHADSMRPDLAEWHRPYFFPLLPQSGAELAKAFTLLRSIVRTAYGHTVYAQAIAAVSLGAGAWALFQRRDPLGWLLVLPVGLAVIASGLGQYSLIPRLLLFALPLLWLISLYGTRYAVERIGWYGRWWIVLLWLPALLGTRNWRAFAMPPHYDETRELIVSLPPASAAPVFVSHAAAPAVGYYQRWHPGGPRQPHYRFADNRRSAIANLLLAQPDSAYLLFSHPNPDLARAELPHVTQRLRQAGYRPETIARRYNGWSIRVSR